MSNTLLFELGSEEIPAPMILPGLEQMRQRFEVLLGEKHLSCSSVRTYSTPRRLAVLITGLPERQSAREEFSPGPPKNVAFDDAGRPTRAAEGFARRLGVDLSELEVVDTPRGPYLGYRRLSQGEPVPEIFRRAFPQIVSTLNWPKNMYWRSSRFRFIRPIRWFVALWNGEVLDFEFEGVRAGRVTRGHRFLGSPEIVLEDAGSYVEELRRSYVLVDVEERRSRIRKELARQTPPGLRLHSDPELTELVVHLNEYPGVLRGSFSEEFLKIPQEVLVTVMRHHQKYFSVEDPEGRLKPHFLTVINTAGDPGDRIRKGHEKVLRARLQDASFFWETDRKVPLKDRLVLLEQVLFQEKLGTYADKTERITRLCSKLAEDSNLELAAQLCKTDLTTDMVREFPELQGIMGGLYARQEGYPESVWNAVYEHYRPLSLEDDCPSTRVGAILSLADKLDSIVGCFGIGIIPTGSSDPFALRRQAQGVVKILLDHRFTYDLGELVDPALENFTPARPAEETRVDVLHFLRKRVRHLLQEKGLAYDVLNAVLAVGADPVYSTYERALALSSIRGEEDFEALAVAYKRIRNILHSQSVDSEAVSREALVEPGEIELFETYARLSPEVERCVQEGDFLTALRKIAGLRSSVNSFFDRVLVLAEDERLRRNRLRLLFEISQLFLKIADISEVVQRETEAEEPPSFGAVETKGQEELKP